MAEVKDITVTVEREDEEFVYLVLDDSWHVQVPRELLRSYMQEQVDPVESVLRNLAIRSGSEEVRGFVGMLILSDRLGTGIARALRSHADAVRSRRRQRAEELARQAGTRLAFPLVFLILPPLFVILLGPAFMEMMHAIKGNL